MLDKAADNKQRAPSNLVAATTTPATIANPPHSPLTAPHQSKNEKFTSQQVQVDQSSHGLTRQFQAQNPVAGLRSHFYADRPPPPANGPLASTNRPPSRRNTYSVETKPSIAFDRKLILEPVGSQMRMYAINNAYFDYDPDAFRKQLASQKRRYALRNASASSVDSTLSPPPVSRVHKGTRPPSHEPVQLPFPPPMVEGPKSGLRERERPASLKAIKERSADGGRSKRKLVPPHG